MGALIPCGCRKATLCQFPVPEFLEALRKGWVLCRSSWCPLALPGSEVTLMSLVASFPLVWPGPDVDTASLNSWNTAESNLWLESFLRLEMVIKPILAEDSVSQASSVCGCVYPHRVEWGHMRHKRGREALVRPQGLCWQSQDLTTGLLNLVCKPWEQKAVTLQWRRLQAGILKVESLPHNHFQGPRKPKNPTKVTPLVV